MHRARTSLRPALLLCAAALVLLSALPLWGRAAGDVGICATAAAAVDAPPSAPSCCEAPRASAPARTCCCCGVERPVGGHHAAPPADCPCVGRGPAAPLVPLLVPVPDAPAGELARFDRAVAVVCVDPPARGAGALAPPLPRARSGPPPRIAFGVWRL